MPYLIVRLKVLWLILFTILSCLAFVVIFQWPQLQYDACRITFDSLPFHTPLNYNDNSLKSIDVDVTYYIGSKWEVPTESFIPLVDIPTLYYNSENKMTSKPDEFTTFAFALKQNLSQLIHLCSALQHQTNKRLIKYKTNQYSTSDIRFQNASITR